MLRDSVCLEYERGQRVELLLVGDRCLLAFSLFIGSHFITAEHGGRSRADVLELALERLAA